MRFWFSALFGGHEDDGRLTVGAKGCFSHEWG